MAASDLQDLDRAFALAARREEPGNRDEAVGILERLVASGADSPRLRFLLASLCDDRSEGLPKAVEHYRAGLALDPADAAAKNNLAVALLGLGRGAEAADLLAATVSEALDYGLAMQNFARLFAELTDSHLERLWLAIVDRVGGEHPRVFVRLARALLDAGREEATEALYARGHALKNLVGLAGARVNTLSRKIRDGVDAAVVNDLAEVARALERGYGDWAAYLKAARAHGCRREICDLNRIARDVVVSFPRPDRPAVDLHEAAPCVVGDPTALREAVFNLAKNAREAAPRGRVIIATGARDEGRSGYVAITDDGAGVAPENLRKIFTPGFTTKPLGSGIGLCVAERVATSMGGRIEVESQPGNGATFTLVLPAAGDAEQKAPPRLKPEEFTR